MKQSLLWMAVMSTLALSGPYAAATEEPAAPKTPAETTLTVVGQPAPDFTVATLDGGPFTLGAHLGQVVLVNWFATWCPPCREEMPHLQREVWEVFGPRGLVMISVARQEEADVVAPFVKKHGTTWPFGLDPDRVAYAQYAEAYIPRNTVIGRDGRIIFQSEGFAAEDFQAMIVAIGAALTE
jgi:peroxiredoxin